MLVPARGNSSVCSVAASAGGKTRMEHDLLGEKAVPADRLAGRLCKEWAENLGLKEGTAIAVGDFDDDGVNELAVGDPDERTVDIGIGQADIERPLVAFGRCVADHVNRIATRPNGRQGIIQRFQRIAFDGRQFDTLVTETVRCHHAGTASVGDDHEALRRAAIVRRRQGSRRREQLSDGLYAQHTRSGQRGREGLVAAGQRAGM